MLNSLINKLQSFATPVSQAIETSKAPPVPKVKKPKKEKVVKSAVSIPDKEVANKRKEPWVDVVAFRVNPENIRNGFYELDWNQYFVDQLRVEGYGYDGDPDEEIVNRWFKEICLNAAMAEGVDLDEESIGSLDVSKIHH